MHLRNIVVATALMAALIQGASCQKMSLNGTWNLSLKKSFLGDDHPANNYQLTIIFADNGASITQRQIARNVFMSNIPVPNTDTSVDLNPDGKEHDVKIPGIIPGIPPSIAAITSVWQGDTLYITERTNVMGRPSITYRRYFLSSGGQELIELVRGHSIFGDSDQRLVFDKKS